MSSRSPEHPWSLRKRLAVLGFGAITTTGLVYAMYYSEDTPRPNAVTPPCEEIGVTEDTLSGLTLDQELKNIDPSGVCRDKLVSRLAILNPDIPLGTIASAKEGTIFVRPVFAKPQLEETGATLGPPSS